MSEGGCGDPGAVTGMAAELFELASLLTGDQERALTTVEHALGGIEIDPCLNPEAARAQARVQVTRTALESLAADQPKNLAAGPAEVGGCVQNDDLSETATMQEQMRAWLGGQGRLEVRRELRTWIESLPLAQRAVFVQRAVLGQSNEEAASLLAEATGPEGAWSAAQVGQTFRLALCSLANSLAHAPADSTQAAFVE